MVLLIYCASKEFWIAFDLIIWYWQDWNAPLKSDDHADIEGYENMIKEIMVFALEEARKGIMF
jgi:hypothetical protein